MMNHKLTTNKFEELMSRKKERAIMKARAKVAGYTSVYVYEHSAYVQAPSDTEAFLEMKKRLKKVRQQMKAKRTLHATGNDYSKY